MHTVHSIPEAPRRLPIVGHIQPLFFERLKFLQSLRPLGDVVKLSFFGRPIYLLMSPALIHQVLVTQGSKFEKGLVFDRARKVLGNGVGTSNGAFHQKQRRLIQPAFHKELVVGYFDSMRQQTLATIERWTPGQKLSVYDSMIRLAFDIIANTLFTSEIDEATLAKLSESFSAILKGALLHILLPKILQRLPIPTNTNFNKAISTFRTITDRIIAEYRLKNTNRGNLLSLLMTKRDEEEVMSEEQLTDEITTLFMAGIETVASSLSWLFYQLGRNPTVEQRIHAEIDNVLAKRPIEFEDIPRLKYINSVLKEVLRLHNPL
jgi:cytochrome P450